MKTEINFERYCHPFTNAKPATLSVADAVECHLGARLRDGQIEQVEANVEQCQKFLAALTQKLADLKILKPEDLLDLLESDPSKTSFNTELG